MKQLLYITLFIVTTSSCKQSFGTDSSNEIIAKVGTHILTSQELNALLPDYNNPSDSTLLAENLITAWVKENLLYDIALRNIENNQEIEHLVNNYRRSLVTYRYQERLLNEKISQYISELEMEQYYQNHLAMFRAETSLIKGLFLKVPLDAPDVNNIKIWYKSLVIKDIEKIEKYSLQNAVNYDYFYDRWVKLDDVSSLFPSDSDLSDSRLKQNKHIELQDSSFYYFLHIKELISPGEQEPLEYAKSNIKEMIINQKKLSFIRNLENELYQTAIKRGEVKRYNKK